MGSGKYRKKLYKRKAYYKKRKQPRNAFVNFVSHFRLRPEAQHVKGKQMFILAGETWRNMSESEREQYKLVQKPARKRSTPHSGQDEE